MKPKHPPLLLPATTMFVTLSLAMATACADTTLVYGELGEQKDAETGEKKEAALSAQRLYIREGTLALETHGESRVVLYDRTAGTVFLLDHDSRTFYDLDAVMVAKLGERLAETQRAVLNGLEKKLAEMPKKEREEMRRLLDDLHKATDLQLDTNPKTRYVEGTKAEPIDSFETSVVDAMKEDQLMARYYLVNYKTLGMTEGEYATLVEFQEFVRRLFEQTPGVMRRHFGDFEMLAKSGRVPVQVIHYDAEGNPEKQKLLNFFNKPIESDWFKIPEDFKFQPLIPVVPADEKGA